MTLAASFAAMTLVRGLWSFTLLACVIAVGDATVKAANGAMIAVAVPPAERVRTRAFIRSTNNAGIALGTLAGGVPLLLDSRAGYLAVLVFNAATYLVAALIVSRAVRVPPAEAPVSRPWMAAATVHVLGELGLSSATFAVAYDLAPDWAQGQYQGAHQTGRQIGNMAAPPVLTALVIGLGVPGWIGLAAIFATAGLISPHIIRWGLRRVQARRRYAETAGEAHIAHAG